MRFDACYQRVNIENIILSVRDQSQNSTITMVLFISNNQNIKAYGDTRLTSVFLWLEKLGGYDECDSQRAQGFFLR